MIPSSRSTAKKVLNAAIANVLSWSRADLAAGVTGANDPGKEGRDVDRTCDYPEKLSLYHYQHMYDRFGIATRVVSCFPAESWRRPPVVYETEDESVTTEFEAAWNALFKSAKTHPWTYLERVDILSGIGSFGVLLLGIGDGRELDRPVAPPPDGKRHPLMYMRAFSESDVTVHSVYDDPRLPNYGDPEFYEIDLASPSVNAEDDGGTTGYPTVEEVVPSATAEVGTTNKVKIHASRVLHVADNRYSSELYGLPRMQQVYNFLADLKKVSGGSAEMFWQCAAPGFAVETHPNIVDPKMDVEDLQEQYRRWRNDQERLFALEGLTIKSLSPQMADPTPTAQHLLQMICATIGFPLRAFLGSELGQMASETDRENLNERLARRQHNYLTPYLVLAFVEKLIAGGVLPAPTQVEVDWEDLSAMQEGEKAKISLQRAQALLQYVTSGIEVVVPLREFLTKIMYFSQDEAEDIVRAAGDNPKLYTKQLWEQVQKGTGNPSDPATDTGSLGKRNAQG